MKTWIFMGLGLLAAAPALAQTEPFTGPRLTASIALDQLKANDDYYELPGRFKTAQLGLTAGYDLRLADKWVGGVEAEIVHPYGGTESALLGRDMFEFKRGRETAIALRLGYVVRPDTLLYAKVGRAETRLKMHRSARIGQEYEHEYSEAKESGTRLGIGVERTFAQHYHAAIEYSHTAYGDLRYQNGVRGDQLRIGVGRRF